MSNELTRLLARAVVWFAIKRERLNWQTQSSIFWVELYNSINMPLFWQRQGFTFLSRLYCFVLNFHSLMWLPIFSITCSKDHFIFVILTCKYPTREYVLHCYHIWHNLRNKECQLGQKLLCQTYAKPIYVGWALVALLDFIFIFYVPTIAYVNKNKLLLLLFFDNEQK